MNSICKTTFTAVLFCASSQGLYAQFKTSNLEIGINAGTLVYQGDLSKSFIGSYKSLKPAIGLYISKSLDPYFALRGSFSYGKISEDELKYSTPVWKQFRAFNFSSSITELSATLVFHLYGQNTGRRFSPYIFGGAGVTFLNIKRDWSKYNTVFYDSKSQVQLGLAADTVHSTPKVIPVLPIGVGVRYALSPQLALTAEAVYRFTGTDYLDGFKYAGNDKRKDNYYGLSVGISYRFGGYKCPPVRK